MAVVDDLAPGMDSLTAQWIRPSTAGSRHRAVTCSGGMLPRTGRHRQMYWNGPAFLSSGASERLTPFWTWHGRENRLMR